MDTFQCIMSYICIKLLMDEKINQDTRIQPPLHEGFVCTLFQIERREIFQTKRIKALLTLSLNALVIQPAQWLTPPHTEPISWLGYTVKKV